jgi:predicted membrane protein
VENSYAPLKIRRIHNNCYLKNKYSSVNAYNVSGALEIEHKYGSVILNNISGEIKIFAPHSKIIASGIQKIIEVESTYKEIDLKNVDKVKVKSRYSIIHINRAKGGEIYNNYGKLYLSNIKGDLKISGKYLLIKGNNIFSKTIKISNSYRDMKLTDFSGGLVVSLSHGDLFLKPLKITSDIEVIANYSDIKFLWPKGEKVPFEGRVKYGKIKVFFPVKYYRENSTVYVKAFKDVKNKPKIFLSTSYGDIFVVNKNDN